MKLLIVDDHALLRRGVRQLIELDFRGCTVFEAKSIAEAREWVSKENLDLVLLDLAMPDATGLEGLFELKRARHDLPILVVSMHAEEQFAIRALKGGAAGYVTKDRSPEELVTAIRRVCSGGRYISPQLGEELAAEILDGKERVLHERLSQQEFRVMCLIASGKTTREIAEQLFLSVKTVSAYRARIFTNEYQKER